MDLDGEAPDVRAEAEIDCLFREARAQLQQSGRERLQHSLARSLAGLCLSSEEQRLRAARGRTGRLARRSQQLESALQYRRSQHAAELRPSFRVGPLPVTFDCGQEGAAFAGGQEEALAHGCDGDVPFEREEPASQRGEAAPSWQRLAERVPRARKQPVRAELSSLLREAGLEHIEKVLYPVSRPFPADAPYLTRRSTVVLSPERGRAPFGSVDDEDATVLTERALPRSEMPAAVAPSAPASSRGGSWGAQAPAVAAVPSSRSSQPAEVATATAVPGSSSSGRPAEDPAAVAASPASSSSSSGPTQAPATAQAAASVEEAEEERPPLAEEPERLSPPMAPRGPRTRPSSATEGSEERQATEWNSEPTSEPSSGSQQSVWRWKATLRSHLDAVRCVAAGEEVLLSCGEDGVVKAWDMACLSRPSFDPKQLEDAEPYANYRGHAGAVLAVERHPEDAGIFFSAGQDATVRAWHLLPLHDPYEAPPGVPRPAAASLRTFLGHEDAVWALSARARSNLLATASADGSVRLWRAEPGAGADSGVPAGDEEATSPELMALSFPVPPQSPGGEPDQEGRDVPAALAWLPRPGALLLTGFCSSLCVTVDMERGASVLPAIEPVLLADGADAGAVTSLACHPVLDVAVAGHADGIARVFSASTGQASAILRGHGAAVSAVAVDPRGGFGVVTGSHDGYVRLFDLRTGGCLWSERLHTRKFDEAVLCVAHAGDRLVTSGADSHIVVLGLAV